MVMVLVVEDSSLFRTTLRDALTARFPALMIEEAQDVCDALRLLRAGTPDLAVLDINLPDGSGLDLAARMHREWPGVAVAICTSHDLPEYREAAGRAGVRSFLVKQKLDWLELAQLIDGDLFARRGMTEGQH
jgi:two-component system, NarL family, response regulator DesR